MFSNPILNDNNMGGVRGLLVEPSKILPDVKSTYNHIGSHLDQIDEGLKKGSRNIDRSLKIIKKQIEDEAITKKTDTYDKLQDIYLKNNKEMPVVTPNVSTGDTITEDHIETKDDLREPLVDPNTPPAKTWIEWFEGYKGLIISIIIGLICVLVVLIYLNYPTKQNTNENMNQKTKHSLTFDNQ